MKRVVVIGSGGSGKSTFSRQLGEITGLPVVHLDKLHWRPNWVSTPADEWEQVVRQEIEKPEWIIDGNFGGTREMRMQAADSIIMLDMPRWLCMYRILRRTVVYRNRTRPDMGEGCTERFDWEFILWVWNYRKDSRKRAFRELESQNGKNIVILKSRREAADFLEAAGLKKYE
ncbi:MAG: DNA topology modulation protein [Pyrinomonadaceae bacterium]